MASKVAEFSFKLIQTGEDDFSLYLVQDGSEIVAQQRITRRGAFSSLSSVSPGQVADFDAIEKNASKLGHAILDIQGVAQTDLANFSAFRNSDPVSVIFNAGYTWLMSNILPGYDLPDLQVKDHTFVLFAEGVLKNRRRPLSGKSGKTGSARPRHAPRNLHEVWF